jgi:hypothetical protein
MEGTAVRYVAGVGGFSAARVVYLKLGNQLYAAQLWSAPCPNYQHPTHGSVHLPLIQPRSAAVRLKHVNNSYDITMAINASKHDRGSPQIMIVNPTPVDPIFCNTRRLYGESLSEVVNSARPQSRCPSPNPALSFQNRSWHEALPHGAYSLGLSSSFLSCLLACCQSRYN